MPERSVTPTIACVGAGQWGRHIVRNMRELGALRWICDADAATRTEVGLKHPGARLTGSIDDVLGDPDVAAVTIATPAATHAALARRALDAGKHVLVEKPLCLSLAEGRALVDLAAARGRVLMVGHLLWYHPAVLKLKQLIDAGELGRIQYICSHRLNLGRIRREENILWSFAPHDLSVILGLAGELPDTVEALGGSYLHSRVADMTVSLLSFPSGLKAHVFVSWLHPFKEQKLVVVGDRKMAVFDDVRTEGKLALYPYTIGWRNQMPFASGAGAEPVTFDDAEPLRDECRHFLECVRTGQRPRTDGEEGLRVLDVLRRCEEALEAVPPPRPPGDVPARPYFVHETAVIDDDVAIGPGTRIWHFSHVLPRSTVGRDCRIGQNVVIGPNVTVGDNVKIQNNVSVYEGVTLESDVFCGPSIVFTNVVNPRSEIPRTDEVRPTLVRRGATLGANATIVCGVTVGEYAFVGAGAVVTRDVAPYALVFGNPARVRGAMCRCGVKLRFAPTRGAQRARCTACGASYVRRAGLVAPAIARAR
jgi:UDP-2-acetamido-3-amino-2,3-dideoxy-glucuronate N-acetyltransferase